MLYPNTPALVLAPMDGITDAPMRALQGAAGAFTFAVSEFLRVSNDPLPKKVFLRDVPELLTNCRTVTGLPVQVQILGGDPGRMARSALAAVAAGAQAIDINFGCPAPTVNRNDGGATLLQHPHRIREVIRAVRDVVSFQIPVSAKLRLGWECISDIHLNAEMAAEGGASWLTIHARTRAQGYSPPVFWKPIGEVRLSTGLPVMANGDIWTLDDFRRCQDETGCLHFMIGRGALANPRLSRQIASELGIVRESWQDTDWIPLLSSFVQFADPHTPRSLMRLKQWMAIASKFGGFPHFDHLKRTTSVDEFFEALRACEESSLLAA
ncbi:MAG: tRNA dihydrouridine synthase [Fimbriimonas sp.]